MGKISLYDYKVLCNDVFYRSFHIFEYIETHPDMSDLEKQAIKATIMDALVTRGCIDPARQSLNFEDYCIEDNLDHYVYEKNPNVCGIPLWMKDEFRKRILVITGGLSIAINLARPASEYGHYCVYDPNTAVSAIFDDATFYQVFYKSPTRGVRIESPRPFVEVNIWGEDYLVDVLTKRIFKSSFFRQTYGWDEVSKVRKSEYSSEALLGYNEAVAEGRVCDLATWLDFSFSFLDSADPRNAELIYERERSKEFFPEAWVELKEIQNDKRRHGLL